ncbi:MAG: hypothetical protein ACOY93_09260 [Bacillota bacterium]
MEREQRTPGAFYGANVEGPLQKIPRVGDDRPSPSPRRVESTMNIPKARQIPVEGAVTGPEAPPAHVDEIRATASLEDLDDLTR